MQYCWKLIKQIANYITHSLTPRFYICVWQHNTYDTFCTLAKKKTSHIQSLKSFHITAMHAGKQYHSLQSGKQSQPKAQTSHILWTQAGRQANHYFFWVLLVNLFSGRASSLSSFLLLFAFLDTGPTYYQVWLATYYQQQTTNNTNKQQTTNKKQHRQTTNNKQRTMNNEQWTRYININNHIYINNNNNYYRLHYWKVIMSEII